MDEQELLSLIIERARRNGWEDGQIVLDTIDRRLAFDVEIVVRGMCMEEEFARYFWKDDPHPEKHLLGMELVENPLNYLAMYVR